MRKFILVAILTSIGITIGYFILKKNVDTRYLPVLNPIDLESEMVDTTLQNKGYGHTIQQFSFIDHNNKSITNETIEGKIWVAEYFFTTCKSICPIMNQEMIKVQEAFKDDQDVKILSFTVDPDVDTPEQLKTYAKEHHSKDGQWYFITGEKDALYAFARQSIFVLKPAEAENLGDGGSDFIHTNNFVLVDWEGKIRGYYDGTNSKEVTQLISDIKLLKKEQEEEN